MTGYKEELRDMGVVEIPCDDFSDDSLLSIASSFGHVVPGARNELVQPLPARDKGSGPKGSFSFTVGYESFPWHTDTAYWDIPARYLLLASDEASPCATLYQSFDEIKENISDYDYLMSRAVFLLDVPGKKRYLSPKFEVAGENGIRLDLHIYRSMNEEASVLKENVCEMLKKKYYRHVWNGHNLVVMDNWRMIHSRENAHGDKKRVLKRIYINELV